MLRGNAERLPDKVAIYYRDREITFAEHYESSQRLAGVLLEKGCEKGDRVAVISKNSVEYLELYSACALIGVILVPINFRLSQAEISWVCENTRPRILFFSSEYRKVSHLLAQEGNHIEHYIAIDTADGDTSSVLNATNPSSSFQLEYSPQEKDAACIVHTSGTTGKAKGAVLGQGGLYAVANAIATDAGLDSTDIGLVMQPLFHVGARFLQLAHHARGAAIRLESAFEPARVWEILQQGQVTTIQLVPTMLAVLLEQYENNYPRTSLKTIFYSTAPIVNELL